MSEGPSDLATPARHPQWIMRSRIFYPAFQLLVHGVLRLLCRLRAHGVENLPGSGPLILAANHQSYIDPFLIGVAISLRPHYLVYTTFMRKPLIGAFCRIFGGIEVGHGPPSRALRSARLALGAGDVLEIYPEGCRSKDGRVLPFARGFAQLARVTGAAVVPIAIVGADGVWPPHRRLPRPGRISVHYGTPMSAPGPADLNGTAARLVDRNFALEVRQAVLDLAGGLLESGREPDRDAEGQGRAAGETG
ncbi:MAG: lysophospholipid acyltransferase family protein [Acidobacteria bacterium]|nr:lysophospholipid acyltransferase family protein [Acidobacteriota bacterium]